MAHFDLETIHKVHVVLKEKGLKISVAESCTGGLVAHALTIRPGASGCFDSSVVCYSRHAKRRLLGLSESFLAEHGTVSGETAKAMALAVREKAGVGVGLGVTGVAGPETIEDREVGLVFAAIAVGDKAVSKKFQFSGERDEIKHSATNSSLQFLYEVISR